jgi:GTPase Era involved in 16S rRNA processing
MHPGWVDTPGLAEQLPGFHRLLRPLLRTPAEGADTIAWLAADAAGATSSRGFWFDRVPRSAHRLARTRRADTAERRARLWSWCDRVAGWSWPTGAR